MHTHVNVLLDNINNKHQPCSVFSISSIFLSLALARSLDLFLSSKLLEEIFLNFSLLKIDQIKHNYTKEVMLE